MPTKAARGTLACHRRAKVKASSAAVPKVRRTTISASGLAAPTTPARRFRSRPSIAMCALRRALPPRRSDTFRHAANASSALYNSFAEYPVLLWRRDVMQLKTFDLNLLVVFETVLRERNVTRAGERL